MTINVLVGQNVVVFPGSRDVGNAAISRTVQLGSVAGQIVTTLVIIEGFEEVVLHIMFQLQGETMRWGRGVW